MTGKGTLAIGLAAHADFEYVFPESKPVVRYQASSFRGTLTVTEPSVHGSRAGSPYEWKLRLNNGVPMDVLAHLGRGTRR